MIMRKPEELATFHQLGLPPLTLCKSRPGTQSVYEYISKAVVYIRADVSKQEFERLAQQALKIHSQVVSGKLRRPCRVYLGLKKL